MSGINFGKHVNALRTWLFIKIEFHAEAEVGAAEQGAGGRSPPPPPNVKIGGASPTHIVKIRVLGDHL